MKKTLDISSSLSVVMYHYVRDIKASNYPGIKGLETSDFINQITFLSTHYNIVTMEQVVDYYTNRTPLPSKAALLTFDDGYAEHFSVVYPILKRFKVQGSFFVPAKVIQEHKVLDVNKIHFVLASCADPMLIVEALRRAVDSHQTEYRLKKFEEYFSQLAVESRYDTKEVVFIKCLLQHALPEPLRLKISDELFAEFVGIKEDVFSRELYLNETQLREMITGGMHIGCHGYDHYWWDKLSNNDLYTEIDLSMSFLSDLDVDMSQWSACYPYGSYSEEVVDLLMRKGCHLGFTTVVNKANLRRDHHLLIPRLDTNDFPPKSNNYKQYD